MHCLVTKSKIAARDKATVGEDGHRSLSVLQRALAQEAGATVSTASVLQPGGLTPKRLAGVCSENHRWRNWDQFCQPSDEL